jgi:hypothetical protein
VCAEREREREREKRERDGDIEKNHQEKGRVYVCGREKDIEIGRQTDRQTEKRSKDRLMNS